MTRIKNSSAPIRSEALYKALLAEDKFQKVWKSLSRKEKWTYMKAQGFDETAPYAIDQFQGTPHIKELEAPLSMPEEDCPSPDDELMPDEMLKVFNILLRPDLVDPLRPTPLSEQAELFNKIKPHAEKIGKAVKAAPNVVNNHANKISENTKKAVSDWSAKSPSEKIAHAGQHIAKAVGNVIHHTKHHLQHEAKMYHSAGKAIAHLATGKKWKDLEPHHKTHLKHALIHAGITAGSMAMGDATGHGGHAISQLLGHFGAEHAHHAAIMGAGKVGLDSVKDGYKKAISAEERKHPLSHSELEKEAQRIVKILIDAEIPQEEWESILHEVEKRKNKR